MKLDPDPSLGRALEIARAVRDAGGRAYLVGGLVRDRVRAALLGEPPSEARDLDLEVYGLPGNALRSLLERFGRVDTVGESFRVYKIGDVDVSLPRRDQKRAPGHRGFTIEGDPDMSVREASRRRDFTINALLWDLLTGEVLDPWGGIEDLRARRLRAVDPATFGEDPLRVLRAMQFAARFEFAIDPGTVALARGIPLEELPAERLWGEFEKLLLRARRPSIGLAAGLEMGVMDRLFPELKALVGCPQEPAWHPEGDVWVHTLQAVDVAAGLVEDLSYPRKAAVLLGTLCHDLGKPPTTRVIDGRIRSLHHEEEGVPPARRLLDRLNVHTLDGFDVRRQVLAIVANHLKPGLFYRERDRLGDGAFRRLAAKCELDLLYRVAKADSLGRRAPGAPEPDAEAQEWFIRKARELAVEHGPPRPLLMGRHLLEMGVAPGPAMGRLLHEVYQLQLDGQVRTLEEAREAARRLLGVTPSEGSP
ncbi:MAG TPA: HD domain-containing protein [Planctomycetota bacterium]|nr:HD domain-containing protein [Planctomycetota bacterium]